jgi:superfamily II DNA or RNA helicase
VDELGSFDLTLADEAHAAGAPTYFDLIARVESYYRLGLTATPFRSHRGEDILLRALFGPPIEIVGLDELEAGGHVARPRLRMIPVPAPALDLTLVWRQLEEALIESPERNRLIVRETLRLVDEVGSALILVRRVRHGELLRELFRESGRDAPFLTGQVGAAERHGTLRAFRESRSGILIGTDVLAVGVDLPSLGGLVLACGQHARVGTLQKVGRVMRVSPGGGPCVRKVVDFDDAALHPLLGEHSEIRRRWMSEILGIQSEEVEHAAERLH